ncbi:MAG: glycoside hydrolase family 66 protein, partial [Eubacteriales bacterium]|nr:glycoside hydrolase family 66 protein [Eubacteriales bacterium]
GEENAVVTQGYYADYTRLLPWQIERIQAYQDFFVRYQDLFFDQSLKDVSLTHACGDNCEYGCDQPFSPEGEPGRLWLTFRESGARKMIGLINLTGVSDDHWNIGKETPTPVENITLHALALYPVKQAWFASPDAGNGAAVPLECVCRDADYGVDVVIRLPKLDVCGLVWLETE